MTPEQIAKACIEQPPCSVLNDRRARVLAKDYLRLHDAALAASLPTGAQHKPLTGDAIKARAQTLGRTLRDFCRDNHVLSVFVPLDGDEDRADLQIDHGKLPPHMKCVLREYGSVYIEIEDDKDAEIADLRATVERLRAEIRQAEDSDATTQAENKRLAERNAELERDLAIERTSVDKIEGQAEAATRGLESLSDKLDAVQERNAELERALKLLAGRQCGSDCKTRYPSDPELTQRCAKCIAEAALSAPQTPAPKESTTE